jgi:hypothetical protein
MDDEKNEYLISAKNHTIGSKYLGVSWVWAEQHLWDNGAKYVLFHDNIKEDFKDFLTITKRPIIDLPILNKSNRNAYEFNSEELQYLQERYKKDFELIEKYSNQEWKRDISIY